MMHGGNVWRGGEPSDWLDYSANIRPEGAPEMTEDEIMRRVVRTENEEFPYLLPSSRQMGMIVFDAADIPKTEETEYADNLCATAL